MAVLFVDLFGSKMMFATTFFLLLATHNLGAFAMK